MFTWIKRLFETKAKRAARIAAETAVAIEKARTEQAASEARWAAFAASRSRTYPRSSTNLQNDRRSAARGTQAAPPPPTYSASDDGLSIMQAMFSSSQAHQDPEPTQRFSSGGSGDFGGGGATGSWEAPSPAPAPCADYSSSSSDSSSSCSSD